MATTAFGTGNALTRKAWQAELIEEAEDEVYFSRFMGEGPNNIIQVKRELMADKGDNITFGLVRILTDAGVTGDAPLKGSEESLDYSSDDVTLEQYRHAVKTDGRLTEQRVNFDIRDNMRTRLSMWLADRIDNLIFDGLELSPTLTEFGGDATSTGTIDAADGCDVDLINRLKARAQHVLPRILPIERSGRDYFVLVAHPGCGYDLKRDSEWQTLQRDARPRSDDNPIFVGALGEIDGVVIHTHPRVGTATNFGAGSNLPGAFNSFMGQQAGCFAWGRMPELVDTEEDYGNQYGMAVSSILGFSKAVFATADYSYISGTTHRTAF